MMVDLLAVIGAVVGFGAALAGFGGLFGAAAAQAAQLAVPQESGQRVQLGEVRRVPAKVQMGRAAPGRCPVCADTMRGVAVVCPDCNVPMHEDCWSYQGGCAIYACAGQQPAAPVAVSR